MLLSQSEGVSTAKPEKKESGSMEKTSLFVILVMCWCVSSFSQVAEEQTWQAAKGPLMTRWAEKVSPANALPEYPRPQMARREWKNLNGLWDYSITGGGGPRTPTFDGEILVPYPIESALSGVMKRVNENSRLWYRRTFEVPSNWQGKRMLLHFEGVDWEAKVAVNGKEVGIHRGGYDRFSFDITDALKTKQAQELVVAVWDPTEGGQPRGKQVRNPNGIWYTPTTGIWRTVWLEPVPEARIADLKINPDVDAGALRLVVEGKGTTSSHTVEVAVLSDNMRIAQRTGNLGAEILIPIPNPKLWSPESPFLYDLRVTLKKGSEQVDSVSSYFGMRKIALGKDDKGITRLMLNGKFIFQVGPLDQGFWPDGIYTAPTDEALRYDIEMTRKLGFNMCRKHVKIEPERWYYWCDKLGLLVWQDMPSSNNRTPQDKEQFELELRRLVETHRNHPSIIMWVVFNEGWGQFDTERLTGLVKEMDPSRLVNNASGWTDRKVGDVMDIHAYPGPSSPKPEAERAAVLGEFGGLGLGVEGHTWTQRTWGYRGMASRSMLTRKYVDLLRKVWDLKDDPGLSAAVYTQTTDVETECNGLMTYDRAMVKPELETVRDANNGVFPPAPELKPLAPTAQKTPITWQYTFEKPAENWYLPEFDAASWKSGPAGFGTEGTPGSIVRTDWETSDIWIRREFALEERELGEVLLLMHHDEDAEVYFNGVLAAKITDYSSSYEEYDIEAEGKAALRPGKNLIAVHCRQTKGGQYIDVGLVEVIPAKAAGDAPEAR
jgi:hypothetical protein